MLSNKWLSGIFSRWLVSYVTSCFKYNRLSLSCSQILLPILLRRREIRPIYKAALHLLKNILQYRNTQLQTCFSTLYTFGIYVETNLLLYLRFSLLHSGKHTVQTTVVILQFVFRWKSVNRTLRIQLIYTLKFSAHPVFGHSSFTLTK